VRRSQPGLLDAAGRQESQTRVVLVLAVVSLCEDRSIAHNECTATDLGPDLDAELGTFYIIREAGGMSVQQPCLGLCTAPGPAS
jgi:hypothetical protein